MTTETAPLYCVKSGREIEPAEVTQGVHGCCDEPVTVLDGSTWPWWYAVVALGLFMAGVIVGKL